MAPATIQREVGLLADAGVLERRVQGRQVFYRAAVSCPIYPELRSIVIKTVGAVRLLARALTPLQESIDVAFVFGSMAAGTERADSDVDLMVVGDATLLEVSGTLAQARAALGRELNVVTLAAAELRRRASEQDHFVTTVLGDPKLFVKGTADDLERVARAGANSAPSGLGE
jgi:predicted nucleotidyltransferase